MNPEDTVLVAVMTRKKDFEIAQTQLWYRIPVDKMSKGVAFNYVAFFFSKRAFKEQSGIHYFAKYDGRHELKTRLDLLPDEPKHKNAHKHYYQLQFESLRAKDPPISNSSKRRFAFMYTTWDRFVKAETLSDLYSKEDHLVDRVFYALQDAGFRPDRQWSAEAAYPLRAAGLRILCEDGQTVVAATTYLNEAVLIDEDSDQTAERIKQAIAAHGGPLMLTTPLE